LSQLHLITEVQEFRMLFGRQGFRPPLGNQLLEPPRQALRQAPMDPKQQVGLGRRIAGVESFRFHPADRMHLFPSLERAANGDLDGTLGRRVRSPLRWDLSYQGGSVSTRDRAGVSSEPPLANSARPL